MAPRSLGTRRARPSQPGPCLALSHGNQLGEPRHGALALFLVNRSWAGVGGPQDVPRGHSFCPVALRSLLGPSLWPLSWLQMLLLLPTRMEEGEGEGEEENEAGSGKQCFPRTPSSRLLPLRARQCPRGTAVGAG